ncbi:MAG: tRNA epoxyqueuosine(34) reductase QueG [Cytophagales bacterium]|nr:tRNA epoxyqueuosine(34) reductase QueG [Cytophagales bacterium]
MNSQKASLFIKQKAEELGFQSCGIAQATFLEEEAPRLENWLLQGRQGEMSYMENHFDKRLDPRKLVDGAKSVVSLTLNYFPENHLEFGKYKVSKYAYGKDYHNVIKKKLKKFLRSIQEEIGEVNGRAFVDSAPVLDKAWAQKSGLGWMGKHSNLITKQVGSFFFICELIIDLELEYDSPYTKDFCGKCTKCIDACPTDAIIAPYQVDGSKCISYYTIELKEAIPQEVQGKFEDWIFGCDICQDVCPWNRFSQPHQEEAFTPNSLFSELNEKDWEEITQDTFDEVFQGSPIRRTKLEGIKRNVQFVQLIDK